MLLRNLIFLDFHFLFSHLFSLWTSGIMLLLGCYGISFKCTPFSAVNRKLPMILVQKSWSLLMRKWCVDYASLVNMKGVKLQRKWFHAVLVERSITSFVWKIGLNIEVCVWLLLVWFKLFSLSKLCFFLQIYFTGVHGHAPPAVLVR